MLNTDPIPMTSEEAYDFLKGCLFELDRLDKLGMSQSELATLVCESCEDAYHLLGDDKRVEIESLSVELYDRIGVPEPYSIVPMTVKH
jgi:hypothetical protein